MRFTTSIFFTFCTMTSILSSVAAFPVNLQKRTVFDPRFIFPAGGEKFYAGETITVTWNTTGLPANLTNTGILVLAKPKGDSENIDFNHTFANGFLLTNGQQQITLPTDIPPAHNYALVLFGDSGNISNEFTIKAAKHHGY